MKANHYVFPAVLLMFILHVLVVRADEGMWLPNLIERLNYANMKEMGLKLTAEEIYSINHTSLKDGIVGLSSNGSTSGFFCSGSVISDQGLIITNYHCAYKYIELHSTLAYDLMNDGFWAMHKEEELINTGLSASFLVRIEDVTKMIIPKLTDGMTETDRSNKVNEITSELKKEASSNGRYQVEIKEFYAGNEYYLFVYEVYKDVRLVGAPPSSIGQFGGDTDNWAWPRHTGDFCLFRIYQSPDGKPAEYHQSNIPLKPKYHIPISLNGYNEGDFTMLLGYPGKTERYFTSQGIQYLTDSYNPELAKIYQEKINVLNRSIKENPDLKFKYAAELSSLSNFYKYFTNQTEIINHNNLIQKKKEEEYAFLSWANSDSGRRDKYADIFQLSEKSYEKSSKISKELFYNLNASYNGPEIFQFSYKFIRLYSQLENNSSEQYIQSTIKTLRDNTDEHFKKFNKELDTRMTQGLLSLYVNNIPEAKMPSEFLSLLKQYKGNVNELTVFLFEKSIFSEKETVVEFLDNPKLKTLQKDPIYVIVNSLYQTLMEVLKEYRSNENEIEVFQRKYIKGLREMHPEKTFYPDANSTMRLSYGTIRSYSKSQDFYEYYTTLDGMIAKESGENSEFIVSPRLKQLYQSRDYGQYGDQGSLKLCFISNNDITGGSSGSPVLNGKGQLIGIAFDSNQDGIAGDVFYNPLLQRTIVLDIRYILFIIDKYAEAKNLIYELKIAGEKPVVIAQNNNIPNKPVVQTVSHNKTIIKPAQISIDDVKLIDPNENNVIDATEQVYLSLMLSNNGQGTAKQLVTEINDNSNTYGLKYQKSISFGDLPPNQSREYRIPIESNINLSQTIASFSIIVREQNGFDSDPIEIKVPTSSFKFPEIKVMDYKYSDNLIVPGNPSYLEILIQNRGLGIAEDIQIEFELPDNVFPAGDFVFTINEMQPNESHKIQFDFLVNKRYFEKELPITVIIKEKYGTRGDKRVLSAMIKGSDDLAVQTFGFNPIENNEPNINITDAFLTSYIDKDIPRNTVKRENRLALIIGNEDYTSYQRTLSSEVNVTHAVNDAKIFREYVTSTLGVEERNVFLLTNATTGLIYQKIDQVTKILEKLGENGELIFYYAGHGQPDEITKVPYLLPVDVSASNLATAISLNELYEKLSSTNARKITIFLDACFSGGGRNSGLLAARGVKVKPKENIIRGNMVVFAASSGDQSALPYDEMNHGMFTYFLLKKLKETKGEVTYKELADYLQYNVSLESLRINNKEQDPQINISVDINTIWENWVLY
ncbi:MAG: S46 family peptidase [Bacteroidetes bacterium]|nr:S46 family peptidase [Bacteroidota bacterium]